MVITPNCKINFGLNVIRKRDDGFHDIESVFYPVGLSDTIEINPSADRQFRFSSSGLDIPGDPGSNLCVKAWELMKSLYHVPPVSIHLDKVIPPGSGLGGGSSDGAFTLKALNEMFRLGLDTGQLKDLASRLGSDCTFFIENVPAVAKGKGEILEKVSVNVGGLYLLIIVPPVHMDTSEAYSMIRPARHESPPEEIISLPVERWRDQMTNDFEVHVCNKYPAIRRIKEILYLNDAIYSSMSGSGSAVFGLFSQIPLLEGLFPGCFVWASSPLTLAPALTGYLR
jgi:4-diphosphocytidyl-2-C-methyl-D-erythritol kinase